jgi:hypothetical protein
VSWHRQPEQATNLFAQVRNHGGDNFWSERAAKALAGLPEPPDSRVTKALDEATKGMLKSTPAIPPRTSGRLRRVMIVGAGLGGQYLFNDLVAHEDREGVTTEVIGFVDDDPDRYENGVPLAPGVSVIGMITDLGRLVDKMRPHEVWIAMPSAPAKARLAALSACREAFVSVKTLPGMHELVRPGPLTNQLRDVTIGDLAGQNPVAVDHTASRWLRSESVFIVGCGTIGRQLAISATRAGAERIVLLDRDEVALRELVKDLREIYGHRRVEGRQGTGICARLMHDLIKDHECTVMFHTASPGWARVQLGLEAEPNSTRTKEAIRELSLFVRLLPKLSRLQSLVWVSDANVSVPHTHTRALWAIAEAIMLGALENEGSLTRCAVRVPPTYSAGSGMVQDLRRDAYANRCLRVPPPDVTCRFAHAHEVAQLVLHAGRVAEPRAIYSLSCGEEQSVSWIAAMLLKLAGRSAVDGVDIEEVESLGVEDPPLPSRTLPTGVDGLLLLGHPQAGTQLGAHINRFLGPEPVTLTELAGECARVAPVEISLTVRDPGDGSGPVI